MSVDNNKYSSMLARLGSGNRGVANGKTGMGKGKGEQRFHFVHSNKVEVLSDEALIEEKHEADIYVAIFHRVKDKLNCDEKHRVIQINREIRKRGIRLKR